MSGTQREIEAKFSLADVALLRPRLIDLGARHRERRHLERNYRLDTEDKRLSRSGEVLRLRQDSQSTLTYKRRLPGQEVRQEINLAVEDLETARALLQALGFRIIAIYEKCREVFSIGKIDIMLDELPFGHFVEVEGPSIDEVGRAVAMLDLKWEKRIQKSYLDLYHELRRRMGWPFRDATFDNFAQLSPGDPGGLHIRKGDHPCSSYGGET